MACVRWPQKVSQQRKGTEYIVDIVTRDGVHKTTMVWVYDRRAANGGLSLLFVVCEWWSLIIANYICQSFRTWYSTQIESASTNCISKFWCFSFIFDLVTCTLWIFGHLLAPVMHQNYWTPLIEKTQWGLNLSMVWMIGVSWNPTCSRR